MTTLQASWTATVTNRRVLLAQWIGNALVLLALALWLHIPDSHLWQLFFSVLLMAAFAVAWLALQCWSFRRFRAERMPEHRWLGWAVLAGFVVLLYLLWLPANAIGDHAELWAPYWYSKLSAGMRGTVGEPRIEGALTWLSLLLGWWIAPASLLPFAMETVARRPGIVAWRRGWRALLHWAYWLLTGISAAVSIWLIRVLISWLPGHSAKAQVISAVLRTGLAYTIAIAAWFCWMAAASVRLFHAERAEGAGRDPAL